MRNITRTLMATLVGATILAGSACVKAAADDMPMHHMPEHGGMGTHGGDFTPHFLHGLELTDAQKDKVFELTYAQIPALREKHKELHKIHEELHKLALSNDYDDSKAHALTTRGAAVMASIGDMMAKTDNRIYQLLTPEQKQQLAKHEAHRDHEHGWHDGAPQPAPAN